ncbi:hypothetical protein GCM10009798_22650 [Nocardioides panacihumi]|uniref:Lipoprotein n=1 Tax=Nocardioides panacihumi TaxID=400774 RepID=A0ABN2R2F4_9ACTN
MRSLSRPLSRRSVQGMLVGAVVLPLTACDLLPQSPPVTPPAPTADELLVDRVVSAVRRARDLAAAVPGAQSLADVHDAHLAALGAPAPTGSPSASPSGAPVVPTPTATALHASEVALEATLTDAADRAGDGALARLLASMAASIAQHVAVLPARKATR